MDRENSDKDVETQPCSTQFITSKFGKINKKIIEIMKDVSAVGKEKTNQQQHFKFRSIDDVYNAIHPIMAKHGVFTTHIISNRTATAKTARGGGSGIWRLNTYWFYFRCDEDDSFIATEVDGEGIDYGDKSSNKCLAIAEKYAITTTFKIPYEKQSEDDPDAKSPDATKLERPKTRKEEEKEEAEKQKDQIKELIKGKANLAKTLFAQIGMTNKDEKTNHMKKIIKGKEPLYYTVKDWDKVLAYLEKEIIKQGKDE